MGNICSILKQTGFNGNRKEIAMNMESKRQDKQIICKLGETEVLALLMNILAN